MKQLSIVCVALLLPFFLCAQAKLTMSGYVKDAESGEELIAATVFDRDSKQGAVCNTYGFFSLTLPSDTVRLQISYVGYTSFDTVFVLRKDVSLSFKLQPSVALREVVVEATAKKIEEEVQMSQVTVPVEQIKHVPALLGEVDILKVLQLLPGVQGGSEGQSGLYVRGGSPDQNLILLDGVPVYNVSHLLGFFSVFNADAIKNVTLTKGGYPARFGGRLSSVLEINMKEGNSEEWHGVASIGLISSRFTIEGPIIKNKASVLFSARRTYADVIFGPIIRASAKQNDVDLSLKLYFYDLNAKVNYRLNDKHRLYLSAYTGTDIFALKTKDEFGSNGNYEQIEAQTDWGNLTTALRWNWQPSQKMFSNVTMTYSNYGFNFLTGFEDKQDGEIQSFSAKYVSGIKDWAGRWDIDYIPNPNNYLRFGGGLTNHTYSPGAIAIKAGIDDFVIDTILGASDIGSYEGMIYAEDEVTWGKLKANIGLHASGFWVQDTFFPSLQPRLGHNYLLSNHVALKASFATMTQFINLLTNESLSLPTDLWVPSTKRVVPQNSWQAAIGAARTFGKDYEVSVEGYYKIMNNVLSYKEGASFLGVTESSWEDKVVQGKGEAYGAELFIQKKTGKTTGWVGYTLSWNWRQFDQINAGEKFPFKYDRRHDFEVVVTHKFSPRIIASGTWVYGTGNAISLPINTFEVYNPNSYWGGLNQVQTSGSKNAFRMSAYHRADVSVEFIKQKKRYNRKWILSAYNAYSRNNPFFVYLGSKETNNGNEPAFKQVSLYPIIPAVSYEVTF